MNFEEEKNILVNESKKLDVIDRAFYLITQRKNRLDLTNKLLLLTHSSSYIELVNPFKLCEYFDNYKDIFEKEDLDSISFVFPAFPVLNSLINSTINEIIDIYKLEDVDQLLKNNEVILFDNKKLLSLSPYLFDERRLKSILLHDLSVLGVNQYNLNIKSIIASFNDTHFRIGLRFSWDVHLDVIREQVAIQDLLNHIGDSIENMESNYISTYPDYKSKYGYEMKIFNKNYKSEVIIDLDSHIIEFDELVEWLKSLDVNLIRIKSIDKYIKQIEQDKTLKEKANKYSKKYLIPLKKNYKGVVNGFTYLLMKINKSIETSLVSQYAEYITYQLFETTIKKDFSNFSIPSHVIFPNDVLIDYMLFLEKREYFIKSYSFSVPNILSSKFPIKTKGMGTKNLYHLFKKSMRQSSSIKELEINFKGYTNEIALKQHMRL